MLSTVKATSVYDYFCEWLSATVYALEFCLLLLLLQGSGFDRECGEMPCQIAWWRIQPLSLKTATGSHHTSYNRQQLEASTQAIKS